jgi:hypothetical protein
MNIRKLIRVYTKLPRLNDEQGRIIPFEAGEDASNGVGVFITAQSILTFPVASSVVTVINQVLTTVLPGLTGNNLFTLIIAFIIGIIIYLISIDDKMSLREKTIGFVLAIINSFFLAASALGLQNVVSSPNL